MKRRSASRIGWAAACAAALAAFFGAGAARATHAAARPPLAASLSDVAFMAGHWTGGDPGDLSEEVWSKPEGDSMVGMWRFVAQGQTRIYEILTLTAENGNVMLRIRHFNPRLVAREEKDRPVELPLVAKGPDEAVFEGPELNLEGTMRLSYRRPTPEFRFRRN
jgi:hypothetical protein